MSKPGVPLQKTLTVRVSQRLGQVPGNLGKWLAEAPGPKS